MQPTPPCSAPICWWQLWALGVAIRHVICGFYLFIYVFIFLPGYVALWYSKIPYRPASERVSWCLETSPLLRLPFQDGSPSLTLLSLFLFFIFVLPPFEDNGLPFWVPGVLCQHQKLFCGICSVFKWSFDEFVGEKVGFPSYSSTILVLPLTHNFLRLYFICNYYKILTIFPVLYNISL